MPILLQATNLSKQYSGQKIFSGLAFTVRTRQKIGVIGRNGAGKSTLFKILTDEEEADEGKVIIGTEAHIGYLKQEDDFNDAESALEYLKRTSVQEVWNIKKLAAKFQLDEEKLNQKAKGLSGGWRMRLKITAMLLAQPNLFLLDEPTNYLDLSTLLLLQNYLQSYKGSFLIISHDREFLKKTCEETLDISPAGCYHYPGNIENYLTFKEQKLSTLVKTNKGLARQQEHLQEFVDRFRYSAARAKQAQSFIRKINKIEAKRITIEHKAGITRISIPPTPKRHNLALRVKNMTIGYGDKPVVTNINLDLPAGEKLAILGLNGQGKTTLLRTLAGFLPPINGSFHWSANTKTAYHGPDPIDNLIGKEQVGEFLQRMAATDLKTQAVLKMAGDFLFHDDELKKSISVLSGGEKSRLLLAGLLLSKPDIFILDEPTCHLDFETVEALGSALMKFNGTVIFTSHDRTFSNLLSTGLLEIKDGQAARILDSYEDYVDDLEAELEQADKSAATKKKDQPIHRDDDYRKKRAVQKEAALLEKKLEKLNLKQLELLQYFLENPVNFDPGKVQELEEVKKMIADREDEWLKIS
ncbi:MAG: ABC-F family ATP-binding cassette domain-containing protein [Patescibacteria group bacterium]|nr:ABC-F family ATP-binding cassette domain-containing protein [Patescibacteria group bacterium]